MMSFSALAVYVGHGILQLKHGGGGGSGMYYALRAGCQIVRRSRHGARPACRIPCGHAASLMVMPHGLQAIRMSWCFQTSQGWTTLGTPNSIQRQHLCGNFRWLQQSQERAPLATMHSKQLP